MDRRDRDRYDRNDDETYYGPYEGYRRDAHYHGAVNLTDKFERDYQRERGHRDEGGDRYRIPHTYHEGDMGGAYERERQEGRGRREYTGSQRNDWDRNRGYSGNLDRDRRDRDDSFWDSPSEDQGRYRSDRDYGSRRERHSSEDRYSSYNRTGNRRSGDEQDIYPGSGGDDRRSRYGGGRASRTEDNWYASGHRRDELNRYY